MKPDKKQLIYKRGENAQLDAQFEGAAGYGKVKAGTDTIFWKEGFQWYAVAIGEAERIYRQVEHVYGKLCCGGRTYDIQRLIVGLKDGTELKMHIGDDMQWQAEELFAALKAAHPQIKYTKA